MEREREGKERGLGREWGRGERIIGGREVMQRLREGGKSLVGKRYIQ